MNSIELNISPVRLGLSFKKRKEKKEIYQKKINK